MDYAPTKTSIFLGFKYLIAFQDPSNSEIVTKTA